MPVSTSNFCACSVGLVLSRLVNFISSVALGVNSIHLISVIVSKHVLRRRKYALLIAASHCVSVYWASEVLGVLSGYIRLLEPKWRCAQTYLQFGEQLARKFACQPEFLTSDHKQPLAIQHCCKFLESLLLVVGSCRWQHKIVQIR